ncbi:MAG: DUF2752 domain-containing protein [Clostridia bacterium]|nr:DUF2752 domain-containing protein [Clostridia bacterium]
MTKRTQFLRTQAYLFAALGLLVLCAFVLPKPLASFFSGCLMHDWLHLYCPLCGGTRAVKALLHVDFGAALRYNAAVVAGIAVFLCIETIAWVCFLMKKEPPVRIGKRFWIACASVAALFFVGRNILMIACGIDPIGDLGGLW